MKKGVPENAPGRCKIGACYITQLGHKPSSFNHSTVFAFFVRLTSAASLRPWAVVGSGPFFDLRSHLNRQVTPYSFLQIFPQNEHERLLVATLDQVSVERNTELHGYSD
jgi:hypothetical protein